MTKPKRVCRDCGGPPLKHINLCVACNDTRKLEIVREKAERWRSGDNSVATTKGGLILAGWAREYLIKTAGEKCTECGWAEVNPALARPILTIDHIDGDWTNNCFDNLKVLCYNCHSITLTFGTLNMGKSVKGRAGRSPTSRRILQGKQKPSENICADDNCNVSIMESSTRCQKHAALLSNAPVIVWPSTAELLDMIKESNYSAVGRSLGVSDNAIRKRLRVRGYDPKTLSVLTN